MTSRVRSNHDNLVRSHCRKILLSLAVLVNCCKNARGNVLLKLFATCIMVY